MKIRVAVLDHNTEFMRRLAKAFQKKYEDKIHLMLFSDKEAYLNLERLGDADLSARPYGEI